MEFVRSLAAPPLVVFTTAYSEYAVDGFKVDAVDYLLKPFGLDDFKRAANKIKKQYDLVNTATLSPVDNDDALFLKTEYKGLFVYITISAMLRVMMNIYVFMLRTAKTCHRIVKHEKNGGTTATIDIYARTSLLYYQSRKNTRGRNTEPYHYG